MKVAEKAISNTLYLISNWIVMTFLSFLYWIFAGKLLLPHEYGKVTTAYQLMFLIGSLSNLGLGIVVSKLIPEFVARKEEKKIPTLIKFSLKISLTTALLFSSLILFLSPFLIKHLELDIYAVFLVSIGIVATQLSVFFSRVWYGYQIMRKILMNSLINQTIKLCVAVLLLYLGYKHLGPITALTLSFFISFLLYFRKKFVKNGVFINTSKIFHQYAIPAFLANLGWIIFNNTQYIILNLLKTAYLTGIFAIAFIICSQITIIPRILTSALFPIISGLSVNKEKEKQSKLISLALKYSLLIGVPLTIFFISFSKPLILIFSRVEYLPASSLFILLGPGALMFGLGRLFLSNIYAVGKPKIYRDISVLVSLSYLFSSLFCVYRWGDYGLALAYLITSFIFFTLSVSFLKREVKIRFEFKDFMKILFSIGFAFMILYLADVLPIPLFFKFILAVIAGVLYLLTLKLTNFYSDEDKKIIFLVRKKLKLRGFEKILDYFI